MKTTNQAIRHSLRKDTLVNTRTSPHSTSRVRSTFVILVTSFLLLAGHFQVAAQTDPLAGASGYFDWLLGRNTSSVLVSPNSVLHTPEGIFRGQDGAQAFGSRLGESFSDLEFELQSAEVTGDSLIIEFQMSGVHTGSYQGMDWDCARVSVPGVAMLEAGEDGFSEQWITYDQQTLLDQIHVHGLVPWNERPSCDAHLRVDAPLSEPIADPQVPPQCLTKFECESEF